MLPERDYRDSRAPGRGYLRAYRRFARRSHRKELPKQKADRKGAESVITEISRFRARYLAKNRGGGFCGAIAALRGEAPSVQNKKPVTRTGFCFGADYGARTRHLHLGKVALYQMS